MFQVEADRKWGWGQILRGLFRLVFGWVHFVGWRIATIVADLFSPGRIREARRSRAEWREARRTGQVRIRRR